MPCPARLILQDLCNTLPAWNLLPAMQTWAPEALAGSWEHLQAAGSWTLQHPAPAVGCPDPKKQIKPTPALPLLLPWLLDRTKAGNRLERACLAQGMSKSCLPPLDTLSKGKIPTSESREPSHRWAVPHSTPPLLVGKRSDSATLPKCPLQAGKSLPARNEAQRCCLAAILEAFPSHSSVILCFCFAA